jgi:hypothetical protein
LVFASQWMLYQHLHQSTRSDARKQRVPPLSEDLAAASSVQVLPSLSEKH